MSAIARKTVDLCVIGAGSGGLEAAWNCAVENKTKQRVAVIDVQQQHGPPYYTAAGGTCVNVGCVPKKLMCTASAMRINAFSDAKGFGYAIQNPYAIDFSWPKFLEAKNKTISDINASYMNEMLNGSIENLSFHEGVGRFVDKNTIEVVDPKDNSVVREIIEAKNILVAVGGWPTFPDTPGLSTYGISSNEAFYLKTIPKRICIIGGGYIAVEFASIFKAFAPADSQVTLSYRGPLFLRGFDTDLRQALADQMRARGIDVRFDNHVKSVELAADGETRIVDFVGGKQEPFDIVMVATGRHPNTARLQLDKAGIAVDTAGAIPVDKFSRSATPNIFAIGDVTNRVQLTPVAIHEAQCFSDGMDGHERAPDHTNVPCAVFATPQLGVVGLTEEDAAKKFKTVAVYRTISTPLMHQLTGNSYKKVVLKIVAAHGDSPAASKVVGVHICAPEAGEMIQGFAVAVKAGATVRDFTSTIGVHPSSAEDLCSMRTPSYFYVDGKKVEKL